MTFSIVARSADGESWGVAVASKFLAVGSAVPAAVAGVGAIATQADANVAYKGLALAHLDDGATASVALLRLLEEDDKREERQVGIVDVDGGAASHTGHACLDWAGSLTGDGYAIQGNILTGEDVVFAMQTAWETSDPEAPAGAPAARGADRRRRGRRRLRAAGSRRRCWWSRRAPATAASTTSPSTCGSTTTRRRSPSWPGCSTLSELYLQASTEDEKVPVTKELEEELRGVRAGAGRPRLPGLGRHRELRDAGRARPVLDRPADPRHRRGPPTRAQ